MGAKEFQVPSNAHGRLIGRGGSTIKGLQSSFGVNITIPKEGTAVLVTGDDANIEACRVEMERVLGFPVGSEELVRAELKIDPAQYGAIIGPGGSTLRSMEGRSGASIEIPSRGSSGPVTVVGTASSVQIAVDALRDAVGYVEVLGTSTASVETPAHETIDLSVRRPIAEALFFPERGDGTPSFDRFVSYLESAKQSIDVCVFTISDNTIASALIHAHVGGIKVRIITDDDSSANQGSDILRMRDAGIPTAMDSSPAHMHHKFAVLDGRVLVNGSFNWTRGAASANCENIVITNQQQLVTAFEGEFQRLWSQFAH